MTTCPTCNYAMYPIDGRAEGFWCQRCGTMTFPHPEGAQYGSAKFVPKLVERCRQLEREYMMGAATPMSSEYPPLTKDWTRLGIAESINIPKRAKEQPT